MAGEGERPGRMSTRSVGRTRRVVEHVESQSLGGTAAGPVRRVLMPGVYRARVTVAIPTATISGTSITPSTSGKVKVITRDAAGDWVDGDEYQVYNQFVISPSYPVNRYCFVVVVAGELWLLTGNCS